MGRILKITAAGFGVVLCLFLAAILFLGRSGADFTGETVTEKDFRTVMGDSIRGNPRVVDIAMLGAHDAFSSGITKKSAADPQETGLVSNRFLGLIGKGMFVRFSKTQKSSAFDLAVRGVRYFDVRITCEEGEWYTTHALLSEPLEIPLVQLLQFLGETEKEVVIFDMQHIYTGGKSLEELFGYIGSVKVEGKSLFDYVRYDPDAIPLGELRYETVTDGGSGVVILAKTEQYEGCFHYEYKTSMRSIWHDKITEEEMLAGIGQEYELLSAHPDLDRDKFRVNQAQMTGSFTPAGLAATIRGWSLLSLAENFNPVLLEQPEFEQWFSALPILMVDYSDSMKMDFNDRVIEAVSEYNRSLSVR